MSHRVSARIVIGMPVYNAEATLSDAIASVLLYPGHDLKLVISDNASTDDTLQICQRFAASDSRVVVVAQSQNIGAVANFDYVLSVADSNFFMWAAADDVRSPHFLDRCVAFLEEHDDYVGVTCPVRFNGGSFEPASMGDASIEQNDPYERMLMFFDGLHANGRFYSLFRRNALKDGIGQKNEYLGADWTLVIRALQKGKLKRLDSGYMDRGTGGASDKPTIFSHYRNRSALWLIPFLDLSIESWKKFDAADRLQRARLVIRLIRLNLVAAIMQVRYELVLRKQKRASPHEAA